MNKKSYFYSIIFMLAMVTFSCESNEKKPDDSKSKELLQDLKSSVVAETPSDKEFIAKVANANKAEVELAHIALARSKNSDIRAFAQKMIKDHTEAENDLKKIAVSKKITIADTLDGETKELKKKLKTLSGADFDNTYAQAQLDGHEKAVQLFKTETKMGKDREVVSFATKYLPHIEMHLEKAKKLTETVSKR